MTHAAVQQCVVSLQEQMTLNASVYVTEKLFELLLILVDDRERFGLYWANFEMHESNMVFEDIFKFKNNTNHQEF